MHDVYGFLFPFMEAVFVTGSTGAAVLKKAILRADGMLAC